MPYHWSYVAASSVFAIAAATDWLDGYLARRLQQSTPFGAFLDPVADKLMVAVALVLLVQVHANFWLTLPAAIIIGREIVVSALREWMAELGARAHVAVSNLGKWKTAAQMLALVILLGNPPVLTFWVALGYALLLVSAGLTLVLPAGGVAALARRLGAEVKVFLNQGVDLRWQLVRMAPITTRE